MELDKMKDAVHSIEMTHTMKSRIKKNCTRTITKKEKPLNFKRWTSAVCAFGILLSITIGILFINQFGGNQINNFTITAYANTHNGTPINSTLSTEKVTFELSTEDRIGVLNRVGGDGWNLIFADVRLHITGEEIETITYTINKGKFIEDVTLSVEETNNKDRLLLEKIYIIYGPSGANVYQGIKEIGNTYTVKYNEQNNNPYSLAIPHVDNVIAEDIIINVTVQYADGKTEQQDILVTQQQDMGVTERLDSISFELQ